MPKISDKKSFDLAIAEMERVAEQLALSKDIVEEAKERFQLLQREGFVTGHSYLGVVFAVLYYKIKQDPSCLAISLRSFSEKSPCTQKEIYRIYSKLVQKEGELPRVCTIRPTIFTKKFGKKIGFSKRTLAGAIRLAEEIVKEKVHLGRDPIALAATLLYAASVKFGEGITQEEIVGGCGVHPVSIRNTLKYLKQKIVYKQFKIISDEILSELIPKLLKIKREGTPFYQLRSELRRSFPDKLKGFAIPYGRLKEAIRRLITKRIIDIIARSGCKKLTEEAADFNSLLVEIRCFDQSIRRPWEVSLCEDLYRYPCPYAIIQLREESTPTQNSTFKKRH